MAGNSPSEITPEAKAAPPRKFGVEPTEISIRSSKTDKEGEGGPEKTRPRKKFLPEPVEETSRTTRKDEPNGHDKADEGQEPGKNQANGTSEKKAKKFAPQPVETVKRVRRRNTGPALEPGDRTDEGPDDKLSLPRHLKAERNPPPVPINSPFNEAAPQLPGVGESRFSYAVLQRKASRSSSVRKPSLDPISSVPESEESNLSKPSSASTDTSARTDARRTLEVPKKKEKDKKGSYDDAFSGYLLDMAARAAQQQLREQAAEAYPNERLYQPINHFAIDESESDNEEGYGQLPQEVPDRFQAKSMSPTGWDARELQMHQDLLKKQREDHQPERYPDTSPFQDPYDNPFNFQVIEDPVTRRDSELKQMRTVARPPMLGGSIVFPKCSSPTATLMDPLQQHGTRRQTGVTSRRQSGLWTPIGRQSPMGRESHKASICLWAGSCTAEQSQRFMLPNNPSLQTGIITPQITPNDEPSDGHVRDDLLGAELSKHQAKQQQHHQLPSKPGSRATSVLGVDQLLAMELRIEEEYPDAFVTQIYNYLSLGYPAIAQDYDAELAKISRMSVDEIRAADMRKDSKGYVGAPEGLGTTEEEVKAECGRWRALRLYVREWARQQPYMMMHGADSMWGTRARRGSWFA